jgi:hypothetical protein
MTQVGTPNLSFALNFSNTQLRLENFLQFLLTMTQRSFRAGGSREFLAWSSSVHSTSNAGRRRSRSKKSPKCQKRETRKTFQSTTCLTRLRKLSPCCTPSGHKRSPLKNRRRQHASNFWRKSERSEGDGSERSLDCRFTTNNAELSTPKPLLRS